MISNLDPATIAKLTDWATVIVIGSGAAGGVVAARLAEIPTNRVLVLELGPNNTTDPYIHMPSEAVFLYDNPDGPQPSPSSLAFDTIPQATRKYRYPRGNGPGGSVNRHTVIDGRGNGLVYDRIAELVDDDQWDYEHVLPYFIKMETYTPAGSEYHGTDGWLKVQQASIKSPFHQSIMKAASEVTGASIHSDLQGPPENADGIGVVDHQIKPNGMRSYVIEDLLLPQMKKGNNLVFLCNTLATKLLFNEEGDRVIGVEAIHRPRAYGADRSAPDRTYDPKKPLTVRFFASHEVILSGGAINTPQLLMVSGIGPREHLEEKGIPVILDRPGVGSQLMDHHEVSVVYEVDPTKLVWPKQAANAIEAIEAIEAILTQPPPVSVSSGSLVSPVSVSSGSLDILALRERLTLLKEHLEPFADAEEKLSTHQSVIIDWFSGMETDIGHDIHIHSAEDFFFDFDLSSNKPLPDGKIRSDYMRSQYNPFHDDFLRVFHHYLIESLVLGSAEGTIRLATADPTVPPLIDLRLYKDDEACERLARGIMMMRNVSRHPLVKQYYKTDTNGDPVELFPGPAYATLEDLKEYVKTWSAFGHHISGTAKMGKFEDGAVVDTRLRVHGIPNLRVVDTSIYPYPYLHGYNTSRGAYLIGEMAADFIKEDLA